MKKFIIFLINTLVININQNIFEFLMIIQVKALPPSRSIPKNSLEPAIYNYCKIYVIRYINNFINMN